MPQPPALKTMLEQLIGTASVSSVSPAWDQSNQGVIELLADWLGTLGFDLEVLPIPGHPGKYNLVASLGQNAAERPSGGLVLSGHSDTVPFDESRWSCDPLRLSERDGRYYGLGTADMKGFFALVIEAIRELPLDRLRQPLQIIATADEESSMCGARDLVRMGQLGRRLSRQVVIGEPTQLRPIRAHKGIGMDAIRLIGQAGHSSNPALGKNALEAMHEVMGEILRWRTGLQTRYHNPAFEVAVPTLNLGHIHGGDNPNRICGQCELHIDLRPLPGMPPLPELRAELGERLDIIARERGLELHHWPLFEGIEPMETPAEAQIVKAAEALSGQSAGSVAFGTEAPFFQELGLEPIILGPGSIDQAHQPDEFLSLEQAQSGTALIRQLVQHFCY